MVVDLNALIMGMVFGLVLAAAIVALLVYATANAPQLEDAPGLNAWRPISRYESQRTYLHASGHHPDVIDW